jgi:hypothetical protein
MTNAAQMCVDHVGGWEVVNSCKIGDSYLITISMVSVDVCIYNDSLHHTLHEEMITHGHRKQVQTEAFFFEEGYPTNDEIEIVLEEYGFNPVISSGNTDLVTFARAGNIAITGNDVVTQIVAPIISVTEGQEDIVEYSATLHPNEFNNLYEMIPIEVTDKPTSMSLKGDWLHLYYAKENLPPPDQFFDRNFFLYSVRIHKDTSQVLRKGYNKGLDLTAEQLAELPGATEIDNIIAVGHYLDEPKTTIYYMRSSNPEDHVNDPAVVEIPYLGTTWLDGKIQHTREYMRDEIN